jgi:hypothetical protein
MVSTVWDACNGSLTAVQNIDPLADTVPPRHQYESDDEDEYNPLPARSDDVAPDFSTSVVGDLPGDKPLLVACGDAGRVWGAGATLGEQAGALHVDGVQVRIRAVRRVRRAEGDERQVGMLFRPSWFNGTVLVSEATATLPLGGMYPYARAVFEQLRPSRYV